MKMFELLPRPLGSIFRKLTHLTCNSRKIKKSKRGEMRLWCGRNRISPDDRREEPRSISTDRRSLPKAVARVVALCGVRMCRGKVKRADGTSASADAAKKTHLMEGEARDEGASAELSDMRRRGSSDAR